MRGELTQGWFPLTPTLIGFAELFTGRRASVRKRSPKRPVNNSGGATTDFFPFTLGIIIPAGFAARPGRRMPRPQRSTFRERVSPLDGGFCPMTNTQNFSPASGRDEFYKDFAGRSQAGISQ